MYAVQGVQLIGAADEVLTFEGALPSVIECIQAFLMEERAKLRASQRAELESPMPSGLPGKPFIRSSCTKVVCNAFHHVMSPPSDDSWRKHFPMLSAFKDQAHWQLAFHLQHGTRQESAEAPYVRSCHGRHWQHHKKQTFGLERVAQPCRYRALSVTPFGPDAWDVLDAAVDKVSPGTCCHPQRQHL